MMIETMYDREESDPTDFPVVSMEDQMWLERTYAESSESLKETEMHSGNGRVSSVKKELVDGVGRNIDSRQGRIYDPFALRLLDGVARCAICGGPFDAPLMLRTCGHSCGFSFFLLQLLRL